MQPNQEQQEFISKRLRSVLKYKDTYEEVYDHILTALEIVPDDGHFFNTVDNIITNELGGAKGIKRIEAKYMKWAIKQFIKDYFSLFVGCLTSAITPIIIAGTVGFYLLVHNIAYNDSSFTPIEMLVCLLPSITQGTLVIKKRVFGTDNVKVTPDYMADARTYVQSVNTGWLGMVIILLDSVTKLLYIYIPKSLQFNLGAYPLTLLFFIAIIHSITYYKLFKDMPVRSLSN
ncbi:MAG: hypothetical protein V4560_07160 [Bacteroidota bacterium]